MTAGVLLPARRRPTPGALYATGIAAFAVLLLVLVSVRLVDPVAVALIGVPLGPIGVVVAAIALPVFTAPLTLPVAMLVIVAALAIAVVNVLVASLIAFVASGRPILRRSTGTAATRRGSGGA